MTNSKKYNIIYADPPWQYANYGYAKTAKGHRAKRGIEKEYSTMTMADIKNMPVHELAAGDCYLFLWVTFPLLQEGLDTITAWGFKYKTLGFNWVKTNKKAGTLFWGMGNITRSNPELCLVGTKGKLTRKSAKVHSVIKYPVGVHSAKPPIVRNHIVMLYGDIPRIELFAREKEPGWDVFGDGCEESDVILVEGEWLFL